MIRRMRLTLLYAAALSCRRAGRPADRCRGAGAADLFRPGAVRPLLAAGARVARLVQRLRDPVGDGHGADDARSLRRGRLNRVPRHADRGGRRPDENRDVRRLRQRDALRAAARSGDSGVQALRAGLKAAISPSAPVVTHYGETPATRKETVCGNRHRFWFTKSGRKNKKNLARFWLQVVVLLAGMAGTLTPVSAPTAGLGAAAAASDGASQVQDAAKAQALAERRQKMIEQCMRDRGSKEDCAKQVDTELAAEGVDRQHSQGEGGRKGRR